MTRPAPLVVGMDVGGTYLRTAVRTLHAPAQVSPAVVDPDRTPPRAPAHRGPTYVTALDVDPVIGALHLAQTLRHHATGVRN